MRELGIRSGGEEGTEREQIMVNVITSLDAPSELQPLVGRKVACGAGLGLGWCWFELLWRKARREREVLLAVCVC